MCVQRESKTLATSSFWKLKNKSLSYVINTHSMLLFAMIRSVVKSFKVPDVEVVAARMSNESALTRMTDSTPNKLGQIDASPGWMS